jgi:hypothetical protein
MSRRQLWEFLVCPTTWESNSAKRWHPLDSLTLPCRIFGGDRPAGLGTHLYQDKLSTNVETYLNGENDLNVENYFNVEICLNVEISQWVYLF